MKYLIDKVEPKKFIYENRQPMNVVTLKVAPNKPCKTCGKNPRRDSSAYCAKCANDYFKSLLK